VDHMWVTNAADSGVNQFNFSVGYALFPDDLHGDFDQIPHHRVHIPADVSDFGEFGGLHLDEGCPGEPGEPSRDLGFPDAGRADHDDVSGRNLGGDFGVEMKPPHPVAERHGHRSFGIALADNVAVQLFDYLARGGFIDGRRRLRPHRKQVADQR